MQVGREDANLLGKFASPICRVDLLPMIAMDRLGVNNELSALKYKVSQTLGNFQNCKFILNNSKRIHFLRMLNNRYEKVFYSVNELIV